MRGPGSRGAPDAALAGGAPAQRSGGSVSDARNVRLRDDVAHLRALVDALPRDLGSTADGGRRSGAAADDSDPDTAALRLRAVIALLMTLDADLHARSAAGGSSVSDDERGVVAGGAVAQGGVEGPGPELAAAAASYIARDLAARRLTEFTSAEAYRLARALAAVGGVAEQVERTLAEANAIRLHPTPLDRAVSHSAG